ncbi:MAG: PDZ domain-containing protein [Lachnospiraceae bacterium]|nr:PDZ domain-containing protein [Lachnospiraceae bacterium]
MNDINGSRRKDQVYDISNAIKRENRESSKSQDRDEGYMFIQETIKKRPSNRRRMFSRFIFTVFLAIIFGIVSSVTFVYLEPKISDYLFPGKDQKVEVSEVKLDRDDITEDIGDKSLNDIEAIDSGKEDSSLTPVSQASVTATSVAADTVNDNGKEAGEDVSEAVSTGEDPSESKDQSSGTTDAADVSENTGVKDAGVKNEEAEPLEQSATDTENNGSGGETDTLVTLSDNEASAVSEDGTDVTVNDTQAAVRELEISDYTMLYQKIGDVADSVKDSMVTVAGISSDTDWFMNSYENNNSTAGIILADNGKELLILTRTSVLRNAESIQVTFSSGEKYPAELKTSDSNTNLSVLAVPMGRLKSATRETFKMAELGNSRLTGIKGKPVIAIGDPLGVSDSIAIGQITSNAVVIDMNDSNVGILTTDIYGSSKASGILCDFEGKVLGIICQDGSTLDVKNLIRAYSISDLKSRMEKILNGQDIAYLGIKGTDVSAEANHELSIPYGAYVKEVITDSPAMKAGIQNGDVIVKIGTNEIGSYDDFMDEILKFQPGEIITITVKRLGKEEYVDISYEVELGEQY